MDQEFEAIYTKTLKAPLAPTPIRFQEQEMFQESMMLPISTAEYSVTP